MEFKDKLILVRAKLNLTQQMLAKELHVTYVTVNRWENGNAKPTKKAVACFNEFCKMRDMLADGDSYEKI